MGGGALGQPLHVALRSEDEDLVLVEIDLQELQELFRAVGVLLQLQQLAEPAQVLVELVRGAVPLVHPVGRDTVLGCAVHVLGPDLDFEQLPAGTEDGGMERLVGVRFGAGDVVLDPLLDRGPVVMDNAEHVITIGHRAHDDPHRHEIVNLVERLAPLPHFLEDGPKVLRPSGDLEPLDAGLPELVIQRDLELEDGLLPGRALGRHLHGQIPVLLGLEKLEGQVFQLGLDAGHAEAVRQRRVDLPGFQRDSGAPLRREMLQGPHVVQPVAQLDDDDPGVFGDGQQQLAVVLHLLFRGGVEGQAGDLGETVHDARDLGAEFAGNVLGADIGVFDHIVQQRGGDGGTVQQLLRQNEGDGNSVGHEVFARHALLPAVSGRAEAERPIHQLQVEPVGMALQHRAKLRCQLGCCSGNRCLRSCHNSPAVAKLTYRSPAMITWSYTGRSSSRPAETSCLVAARSSAEGVGSPLG